MTYLTAIKPTHRPSALSTCSSCPYFEDFNEANGRGWCKIFDTVARKHHKESQVCDWEIAYYEQGMAATELPPCPYSIGDKVKVIEPEVADSSQWPIFVIVSKKYNPERYRSISAYLEETSWYFGLKNIDLELEARPEIWISEDRLCTLAGATRVNAAGEF